MVSLESLSSVEHATKMIFLIPLLKVVIEFFGIVDGILLFLFVKKSSREKFFFSRR